LLRPIRRQVARQIAPIIAGVYTDPFTVTANDGWGGTTTVTLTPAIAPNGPVPQDATATLQAAFDHRKAGGTLTLATGTYQYSNVLHVNVSGVTINGNGATLQSINPRLRRYRSWPITFRSVISISPDRWDSRGWTTPIESECCSVVTDSP
jgi:hypothetical protein